MGARSGLLPSLRAGAAGSDHPPAPFPTARGAVDPLHPPPCSVFVGARRGGGCPASRPPHLLLPAGARAWRGLSEARPAAACPGAAGFVQAAPGFEGARSLLSEGRKVPVPPEETRAGRGEAGGGGRRRWWWWERGGHLLSVSPASAGPPRPPSGPCSCRVKFLLGLCAAGADKGLPGPGQGAGFPGVGVKNRKVVVVVVVVVVVGRIKILARNEFGVVRAYCSSCP